MQFWNYCALTHAKVFRDCGLTLCQYPSISSHGFVILRACHVRSGSDVCSFPCLLILPQALTFCCTSDLNSCQTGILRQLYLCKILSRKERSENQHRLRPWDRRFEVLLRKAPASPPIQGSILSEVSSCGCFAGICPQSDHNAKIPSAVLYPPN